MGGDSDKKHWGNLATIRGIIYYRLSPRELKPFAKTISHGLPNFAPRTFATVFTWLPCFLFTYALFKGLEEQYRLKQRKNPLDYVNEVDPNAVQDETENC